MPRSNFGANTSPIPASYLVMQGVFRHVVAREANRLSSPSDVVKPSAPTGDRRYPWLLRLMENDGPRLLNLALRMVRNRADALDVYQDCLCRLAALGSAPEIRDLRAYAFRTVSNLAVEIIRGRGKRAKFVAATQSNGLSATGEHPAALPPQEWNMRGLQDAVSQLPAHLRQVVVLRDLAEMSYAEVGRTLGIDPATARVYRRHAVVRLSELMSPQ